MRKTSGKRSKFLRDGPQLEAKTEAQKAYINALKTSDQVVVLGPAGTGKTFVAASYAALALLDGEIDKIVITRPHVSVGKDIGHLPGTLLEKTVVFKDIMMEPSNVKMIAVDLIQLVAIIVVILK